MTGRCGETMTGRHETTGRDDRRCGETKVVVTVARCCHGTIDNWS